jgi:hypothetical protein
MRFEHMAGDAVFIIPSYVTSLLSNDWSSEEVYFITMWTSEVSSKIPSMAQHITPTNCYTCSKT